MSERAERAVVITTIFPPTEVVRKFAAMSGWRLVVAGDRKTPADWAHPGVTFLSGADQERSGYRIARELPWNHYCRKMIGYVRAIRMGAQVIVDTDDDNIPKPDWSFPEFEGEFLTTGNRLGFINVYRLFTGQTIWPRGFPLELLTSPQAAPTRDQLTPAVSRVGIWQGLADGDPDVDAIYRLTNNTACYFNDGPPVVLGEGTVCPFNSQNTAYHRELFPLLYMPAHVTFRFTDILRGLVAQPILWAAGWRLGFTKATVVQERNPHNYLKDFESEIPCYLHAAKVIDVVGSVVSSRLPVLENLVRAYRELVRVGIVPDRELPLLDAWLEDVGQGADE
ncbi:MAG TPA: STELLO glycosyltransferase family protein [Tepidisphaeraceae bacterium]|nr:STELLO glycosyltransferase family protein [Tepidisphaeraceae bacterium]